jgi:hypothetical protein
MQKLILSIFLVILSFNSFAISPEDLRDQVRRTYFFIAGFPDTATRDSLQPGTNIGGMLGIVNDYLNVADSILLQQNVSSCAAIPTSGTLAGSIVDNGTSFSVSLALSNSVKLKPVGFPSGGTSYQKRMEINVNGIKEMTVEFDCSRKAGWFSFRETLSTRTINMFYDNESVDQMFADFYMLNEGISNDKSRTSISFRTEPGNLFSFIFINSFQNNMVDDYRGTRTVAKGNWASNIISVVFQEIDTKTTFDGISGASGATSTTVVENTSLGDAKQTVGCIRDLVGSIGSTCPEVPLVENALSTSLYDGSFWNLNWTASSTGLSSKVMTP